ncbi:hypothetical protein ANANG_G00129930 [Anguilla anguilla]|uniref:Uncharacterized protein n=1 Tax=Anguilla anguilla TaxID=7936 RepID=A0A9D3MHQ3_ANGAN|nr:hypothetical protein ANANG_G00129930 [Anguilla anguilla]
MKDRPTGGPSGIWGAQPCDPFYGDQNRPVPPWLGTGHPWPSLSLHLPKLPWLSPFSTEDLRTGRQDLYTMLYQRQENKWRSDLLVVVASQVVDISALSWRSFNTAREPIPSKAPSDPCQNRHLRHWPVPYCLF